MGLELIGWLLTNNQLPVGLCDTASLCLVYVKH